MNVSDNPNQQQQQQQPPAQQQQPVVTATQQQQQAAAAANQCAPDFTHQTFQKWLDLLVDPNSSDEVRLKAITDLSLNLEVYRWPH